MFWVSVWEGLSQLIKRRFCAQIWIQYQSRGMCYIITMTMWVKLAILDSLPFTVIYFVSGNLFFIWCLFLINSFNMGGYGVKIAAVSFVTAEHLWGLPRKRDSFILVSLQVLVFWWLFLINVLHCFFWNRTVTTSVLLSFNLSHKKKGGSLWKGQRGGPRRKNFQDREEVTLRYGSATEKGEAPTQWVHAATETPDCFL